MEENELKTETGTYIEDVHSTLEIPQFTDEEADNREHESCPDDEEGGK